MITGLVDTRRPADPDTIDGLTDTLACLVAGVAAGLVGDAVILSRIHDDRLAEIAEGSGARFLVLQAAEDPWQAGARIARREWLFCLEAGDIPREGWIRVLDRFTGTARPDIVLGRLQRTHGGLFERMRSRLDRLVGTAAVRPGDVVRRDHLLGAQPPAARVKPRDLPSRIDRV